jgi:hypothetical protein
MCCHLGGEVAIEVADADASTLARQRTRRRVAVAARPPVIATTFLDRERR